MGIYVHLVQAGSSILHCWCEGRGARRKRKIKAKKEDMIIISNIE
jgi:hypothetical protein